MIEPDIYFIPILKVKRWLLYKADALWSSSQDDTARFESGALGEEGDGLTDVEYLIGGCTILNGVPVECTFQKDLLWIRYGVVGHKTWTKGICVVKTLGEIPLRGSHLVFAK